MCTLLVHAPADPGAPLLLGANRDESYGRPSQGPGLLSTLPPVWGGRDLEAQGTWLCARLAPPFRVVAVLNRPELSGGDPHATPAPAPAGPRRSRGLLCLEAARADSLAAAREEARRQVEVLGSAPFNLVLLEAGAFVVLSYDGAALESRTLGPGWHALTHGAPDDLGDARIARALSDAASAAPSLETLARVLSQNEGPGAACRHGERYGTVSSTLVEADLQRGSFVWKYAAGPPCQAAYEILPVTRPGPADIAPHAPR